MKSAQELVNQINGNLSGTYELTEDLDASALTSSNPLVSGTFTGTLNGNGYTIYNLKTPLFTKLNGAKINKLRIADANISGEQYGILVSGALENQTVIDGLTFENCM